MLGIIPGPTATPGDVVRGEGLHLAGNYSLRKAVSGMMRVALRAGR